jgi:hypothetical protein
MKDLEQNTCAHIPCTCVVERGEKYCGDFCKNAGSEEVEIACECGHATCSLTTEEVEDVANTCKARPKNVGISDNLGGSVAALDHSLNRRLGAGFPQHLQTLLAQTAVGQ